MNYTLTDTDVSEAITNLVNEFPALGENEEIVFSQLEDVKGFSLFPSGGSALQSNVEDITGHVTQMVSYPFTVIYRGSPKNDRHKMRVKEFLDLLGEWLEKRPVQIEGTSYQITDYPILSEGKEIKSIARTGVASMTAAYEDGTQDWSITCEILYQNEFDR